jgi:uncharacterized membrane protein
MVDFGPFEYVLNRLREASTWAGIALFIGTFGIDADTISRITANGPAIAAGVASLVAILAPSRFGGHTGLKPSEAATQRGNT